MTSGPGSSEAIAHPRAQMFTFALALAAGILLAHFLWRPPLWIAVAATVMAISAALVVSRRPRLAWIIAYLGIVCLGWTAMIGQLDQRVAENKLDHVAPFADGKPVTIVATVTHAPSVFAEKSDHEQIDVETESACE